jgi:hypothetical protein
MLKHGFLAARLILLAALICAWAAPAPAVETLVTLDGEAAGDQFGTWISTSGDFNGDGYKDFLVAATSNATNGTQSGRAYVYLGGAVPDAVPDLVLTGSTAGDRLGVAAAVGDVNNDGFDDFVVGAAGNVGQIPGPWTPGSAYLFFGGATLDGVPDLVFNGEYPADMFGATLAGLGDLNADGDDDFIINAAWWPNKGYRGKAYIYFGGPGLDNVADMMFTMTEGEMGIGVCPGGDFDGDGYNDLLIGAYKKDMPAFDSGAAWLHLGGPGLDAAPDFTFGGENWGDWFGSAMDWVGDLNGDGYNDLAIGASRYPSLADRGRTYIYFGGPALDTTPDLIITGVANGDVCRSIAGIGDINCDGFDDLAVGARGNDEAGTDAGKVYFYFGGPGIDAVPDLELLGEAAGDGFGLHVRGLGDINGDSRPDVAIGSPYHDGSAGRVIVYTLGPTCIALDIKPRSCPNPLNVKIFEMDPPPNAKSMKGGVLPVAVLGSDVSRIDVSSLLLEGVAPLRHSYEDVSTPVQNGDECDCTSAGSDGTMDLTLKFLTRDIAAAIGPVFEGDEIALTLTGQLLDGTPFEASDCVRILSKREAPSVIADPEDFVLGPAVPNPFNPVAQISYELPREGFVELSVFDVAGRLVENLVAEVRPAGKHVVEWNAKGMPSGVYFYRIDVGNFTETRKMILFK